MSSTTGTDSPTPAKLPFDLEFERVIDAPRDRVFAAWTEPEQMKQWFAPRPFQLVIHSMDFRPGGRFSMAMRGPDGNDFPFTGTYRQIEPPSKLVWTGEFPGGPPEQMTTTVTFEALGDKTRVRAKQTFHVMTTTIKHALVGAKQGWTLTLDQLVQFTTQGV